MGYKEIWEWVYEHYDINQYFTPEELIYDVQREFNRTNSYFPPQAADLIKERFQYRREYAEMQRRQDEQQKISDLIGSGVIAESLQDQMIADLNRPEIMGIDVSEFSTQREAVVPPEIIRYAERQANRPSQFIQRVKTWFGRLWNR